MGHTHEHAIWTAYNPVYGRVLTIYFIANPSRRVIIRESHKRANACAAPYMTIKTQLKINT